LKNLLSIGAKSAAGAWSSLWTFPAILGSSMMIAWAAESAQFFLSQGLSLAILAWIQTLPEFAVEAVIAWQAPKIPHGLELISANFTGSLRLLTGLGWPLIFFTAAFFYYKRYKKILKEIHLDEEHCVEVMGLLLPQFYFVYIVFKGTLNIWDGIALFFFYFVYIAVLNKIPPKEIHDPKDEEWPIRKIVVMEPKKRNFTIASLFIAGTVIILFTAEPFLHSLMALAVTLGVSQYVFIQWLAPFLSEFPEKVSAMYWARKIKGAPMAMMNMVSSNINQWTMLAGMIPIVYAISSHGLNPVVFDHHQKIELALTILQSLLGFCFLVNMKFSWHEAVGLFVLWAVQFFVPSSREVIIFAYAAWVVIEFALWIFGVNKPVAFKKFAHLWKERVRVKPAA
jgi:cation:H+ antiporter